jgi:hypothetical protein
MQSSMLTAIAPTSVSFRLCSPLPLPPTRWTPRVSEIHGALSVKRGPSAALNLCCHFLTRRHFSCDAKWSGYVYVPQACQNGAKCDLLSVMHGCLQGYYTVGSALIAQSNLNGCTCKQFACHAVL